MQAVAKPAGGGVPVLAVEGDDEEVVLCCFLADADLGEVRLPPVTLSLRKKNMFLNLRRHVFLSQKSRLRFLRRAV